VLLEALVKALTVGVPAYWIQPLAHIGSERRKPYKNKDEFIFSLAQTEKTASVSSWTHRRIKVGPEICICTWLFGFC
jgi:hypothetical protein